MKKVKVLAILLILLLVVSCGKKGKGKEKGFDLKKSGGTNQQVNEIQKYNWYVGVYNKLLNFEKTVGFYFEKV